ncbi:hypothetical protein HK097_005520 [Rhizophlyctis rosea]|uniref:Fe2OG dioxygenase domain-containing protein n=1 Tax=Rhizophlyctis rosea TaxID=64517 RepID=A0AAD5SGN9_9FUNG|nr:hypothetical protein HK097_005520 [Rhizophlyctis rosea]
MSASRTKKKNETCGKVKTLANRSAEVIFTNFAQAVQNVKSTFCCGGTVYPPATSPTTLWYDKEDGSAGKVVLPIDGDVEDALKPILSLAQPATFGRGQENVYDPSYRTALKLEPSQFACTFDLASHGILEEIRTVMMPTQTAIEAQLYKLNVYGPGGLFKSHVDTPRGGAMFGSLVVCLPVQFEGGKLVVKQDEESIDFNWAEDMRDARKAPEQPGEGTPSASTEMAIEHSTDDAAASHPNNDRDVDRGLARLKDERGAIRWAAFYSDCDHSIQPVLSGHRFTLTYNLYATSAIGNVGLSSISAATLPIYKKLKRLLSLSHFMPEGGRLGFSCQHAYPHTARGFVDIIESMLKGTDMAIFHCMRQLGLNVSVRPVYSFSRFGRSDWDEDRHRSLRMKEEKQPDVMDLSSYRRRGKPVGKAFHGVFYRPDTRYNDDGLTRSEATLGIPLHRDEDIVWVVLPEEKLIDLVGMYTAHGNESATEGVYNAAALIVNVPGWADRKSGKMWSDFRVHHGEEELLVDKLVRGSTWSTSDYGFRDDSSAGSRSAEEDEDGEDGDGVVASLANASEDEDQSTFATSAFAQQGMLPAVQTPGGPPFVGAPAQQFFPGAPPLMYPYPPTAHPFAPAGLIQTPWPLIPPPGFIPPPPGWRGNFMGAAPPPPPPGSGAPPPPPGTHQYLPGPAGTFPIPYPPGLYPTQQLTSAQHVNTALGDQVESESFGEQSGSLKRKLGVDGEEGDVESDGQDGESWEGEHDDAGKKKAKMGGLEGEETS